MESVHGVSTCYCLGGKCNQGVSKCKDTKSDYLRKHCEHDSSLDMAEFPVMAGGVIFKNVFCMLCYGQYFDSHTVVGAYTNKKDNKSETGDSDSQRGELGEYFYHPTLQHLKW